MVVNSVMPRASISARRRAMVSPTVVWLTLLMIGFTTTIVHGEVLSSTGPTDRAIQSAYRRRAPGRTHCALVGCPSGPRRPSEATDGKWEEVPSGERPYSV